MNSNFRIVGLPRETFRELFALDDAALRARGVERRTVSEANAAPCRVSLVDAAVGERVLLLPFVHHDVDSPYRASGPIFVRESAETARLETNQIPPMLERRLLSVRAYDAKAMLVASDVLEGMDLRRSIEACFANPEVAYLHVHNARPGCFNCRVERAG